MLRPGDASGAATCAAACTGAGGAGGAGPHWTSAEHAGQLTRWPKALSGTRDFWPQFGQVMFMNMGPLPR